MFFLVILFLLLAAAWLHHRAQEPRRKAVANLPGPFNIPFLGAVHTFYNVNPKNLLKLGAEKIQQFGYLQKAWVLNRLIVSTSDMEFNEQLLASQEHLVKHPVYKMLGQWLGNGLLLSDGKTWHQRRKIITPAFHFKILEQFVEVFDQQSSICLERLAKKADGKSVFDIYPFVCLAALDIIAETAMGTKVHAQTSSASPYANAVNETTALLSWRFMSVVLNNEIIFTLLYPHLKWRQMKLIRIMHDFTIKVIEQRRQTLEATQQKELDKQHTDDIDVGSKRRMALLDVLLQSTVDGRPLSNEEIREEVDTFMFEGHDTTTSGISFALTLLSRHPKVQEKLRSEVMSVIGADRERPITLRDLNELKYTECVIKESLRMYPSVPMVGRKLQTDFKYKHSKFGNGTLPAGTEVLIGIVGAMRNENLFKDPHFFIPERHEQGDQAGPYAFVPFSAGPRNCVGQKFAQLEMKVMLAKIVRDYELLPLGEPVEPVVNIVLRSDNGFQLGLQKRKD